MKKSILLIAMVIAIAVGIFEVSASPTPLGYTLNLTSAQNTAIVGTPDGNFGSMLAGNSNTINTTFQSVNSGNVNGNVDARFTTNYSTNFGMTTGSAVITASAFTMFKHSGTPTALETSGADARLLQPAVASGNPTENWDITVAVPAGSTGGNYTGTIQITFS